MSLRQIVLKLTAKESELTPEFSVFRALPRRELRRVGGFVFLDHFDAADVRPEMFDVPPHPHIGLQTVTYLYDGEILHTDSLGYQQMIEPGAVNWMTSGRGITHSEQVVETQPRVRGLQIWIGLPQSDRKTAPAFDHFDAAEFPQCEVGSATMRVLAGRAEGLESPVKTFQELTYLDIDARAGADFKIKVAPHHELAVYVCDGEVEVGGETLGKFDLGKLSDDGDEFAFSSASGARLALIGGEPLPEPTVIYWNFITDTVGEAKQAAIDWEEGRFPVVEKYEKIGG